MCPNWQQAKAPIAGVSIHALGRDPTAASRKGKGKVGYTAHTQLRCNEPQANEREQRMDGKDCHKQSPHLNKLERTHAQRARRRDRKSGAGSAEHAILARLQKGTRGKKARGAQTGSNATRPHTSQRHLKACCCHADMQAGCTQRHTHMQAGHTHTEHTELRLHLHTHMQSVADNTQATAPYHHNRPHKKRLIGQQTRACSPGHHS